MSLQQYQTTLAEIKDKVLHLSRTKPNLKETVTSGRYIYDYDTNRAKLTADRVKKLAADLLVVIEKTRKNAESRGTSKHIVEALTRIMIDTKFIQEYSLEPSKALETITKIERELASINGPAPAATATARKDVDLDIDSAQVRRKAVEREDRPARSVEPPMQPLERSAPHTVNVNVQIPELPEEIADYVNEDIDEAQRCFGAKCYRSAIILCGRILETALHRKYFEVTGKDALEKEPGIGIGKLIAKLDEKNVKLDPALPQQIHFINQSRIFSVHTKKEQFRPSKNQAHATILYTVDALWRIFPPAVTESDVREVKGARRIEL